MDLQSIDSLVYKHQRCSCGNKAVSDCDEICSDPVIDDEELLLSVTFFSKGCFGAEYSSQGSHHPDENIQPIVL
jgi:hypothetical protein